MTTESRPITSQRFVMNDDIPANGGVMTVTSTGSIQVVNDIVVDSITVSGEVCVNGMTGQSNPAGTRYVYLDANNCMNYSPDPIGGGGAGFQGPTGPSGPQGTTGFQGSQGSQGFQGTTGFQGSQGFQGTTGFQGSQGFQGTTGFQGFQGDTGFQGPQGPTGSFTPLGTNYSDHIYWNSYTSSWEVESSGKVHIGSSAGFTGQNTNAVAIGNQAGYSNQGSNAIAIGNQAGMTGQAANSIILNASGLPINGSTGNALYISPMGTTGSFGNNLMFYNPSTSEVRYDTGGYIGVGYTFASTCGFPVTTIFAASFIQSPQLPFPYDTTLYKFFTLDISLVLQTDVSGLDLQYGFALLRDPPGTLISPFLFSSPIKPITKSNFSFGGNRHHLTFRDYILLNTVTPEISKGNLFRLLGFVSCASGTCNITGGRFVWTLNLSN